ncbi:MAG: hypothetical protein ACLQVD_13260 [Capsulimonadaceae bacterium]
MTTANINTQQRIYALQHMESGEFICLLQEGVDYLACFSDGDTALEFRAALGLQEHVDMYCSTLNASPFTHFWLDGESIEIRHEVVR